MSANTGVVILDFNQRLLTIRCISALAQGDELPQDVVLVENGDPLSLEPEFNRPQWKLHTLRAGYNLGCAGGRNAGLAHLASKTACSVFVVLDNDTIPGREFIRSVGASALADGEVIAPVIGDLDAGGIWSSGGVVSARGEVEQLTDNQPERFRIVDWAPGACLIMTRQTWITVGAFDPWMNFLFEDIEWCLRLRQMGGRVVVDKQLQLIHQPNQSMGGPWSPSRVYYWARNGTVFLSRLHGAPSLSLMRWLGRELVCMLGDVFTGHMSWTVARMRGLIDGVIRILKEGGLSARGMAIDRSGVTAASFSDSKTSQAHDTLGE